MTIFTDTQRFRCFGCGVHGDVVDFEKLAGSHERLWTAMISLSVRYGVPMPERSPEWIAWQNHKQRRREMARHALTASYQRRYFRLYGTHLKDIRDPDERREDAQRLWDGLYPLAYLSATRRLGL